MGTRITQGMMNNQLLRNISANLSRMNESQNQLSTGRRINAPSDDPVGISFSLRYRSEVSVNDQYQSNADSAVSWVDFSDGMLGQAGDVLQRARELAVEGSTGSNPQLALDAINVEVKQLFSHMVNIGNSQFNGKYVFNGQLTDKPPYNEATADADTGTVDDGEIKFDMGVGVRMPVNVLGKQAFGVPYDATDPAKDNVFKALQDLSAALASGDIKEVSDNIIGRLDKLHDKLLEARSDIGARANRIGLSQSRLQDIGLNLQTLQSKTEDADISAVITNLKTDENVYQASLSVGSKIISTSLIDFLR
ncbi:flagellar hook-associated protein FlgL [Paenibacillus qinlingensis]|uniref:Flagellar hook-associated protein 3 FlgL n=1 Tax=Paenibacillus qinlingensis TaxID=1837343 RepID=A0ABU1P1I3_9BACL|nr:flagellar hook-associated protein FlgL [Paenibacillus qinlingensis]MDR6553608.1 flagellar hook-associated protein 3 FlgL [Paenibacillus qinlingensis]